jgi:hypothetical protein
MDLTIMYQAKDRISRALLRKQGMFVLDAFEGHLTIEISSVIPS